MDRRENLFSKIVVLQFCWDFSMITQHLITKTKQLW